MPAASVPRGLSAVDVQDLASDEAGTFAVQDRVDDVADGAQPADRVKAGHALVGRGVMVGRLDDSRGDGVDSHATRLSIRPNRSSAWPTTRWAVPTFVMSPW